MTHSEHEGHHIVPIKTYLAVYGALLVLTVLTVAVALIDFPQPWAIIVAIAVAGTKASLVAMFFMALKYDSRVNTMVFLAGIVFLAVFLIFTILDTEFRGDENAPPEEAQMGGEETAALVEQGDAAGRPTTRAPGTNRIVHMYGQYTNQPAISLKRG